MHGAERVDVVRELGNMHVGKFRGSAGGDVTGGIGDPQQGPGERASEQPGDEPRRQQQHQPGGADGALDGVDLLIDDDQSRGYADHGKPGGAVLDGDVQLRFVGGRAHPLVHSDGPGRVQHGSDLWPRAMVLEPCQRCAIELGVAADVAVGIDQGHAASQARAGEHRELRPARGVGRREGGDQPRLALQLAGDLLLEMPAE